MKWEQPEEWHATSKDGAVRFTILVEPNTGQFELLVAPRSTRILAPAPAYYYKLKQAKRAAHVWDEKRRKGEPKARKEKQKHV